jgi:hypothetical protein
MNGFEQKDCTKFTMEERSLKHEISYLFIVKFFEYIYIEYEFSLRRIFTACIL